MNIFIDVIAILCIAIIFFILGFNFGWNQCDKFNKIKNTNSKEE